MKKILLKAKFLNIAQLFSEGQQENLSIFTLDRLFDVFKTDVPDFSQKVKESSSASASQYIIDINVNKKRASTYQK